MIYVLFFVIDCWLLYLGSYTRYKKVFFFASVFFLALIAGLRSTSIGTDVNVYLVNMYNGALQSNNFNDFQKYSWYSVFRYRYVYEYEVGFTSLVYLSSKIFCNLQVLMFIIELMILVPFFHGLKNLESRYKIRYYYIFSSICFLLLFYNVTLNLMRQWIAISFIFLSFSFIEKKNVFATIFYAIIALLFHKSAIIGLIFNFIYILFNSRIFALSLKKYLFVFLVSFFLASSFLLMIFPNLLGYFGLEEYVVYIKNGAQLNINQLLQRVPIYLLLFFALFKNKEKMKDSFFIFLVLLADLLISQFAENNAFVTRICYYLMIYYIFIFLEINKAIKNSCNHLSMKLVYFYELLYCFLFWVYFYYYKNANQTIPYQLYVDFFK